MILKDMNSMRERVTELLKELPEDIHVESVSSVDCRGGYARINVERLEDFRRLATLYVAEVKIQRSSFPKVSGGKQAMCQFCAEDGFLQFIWRGKVSGYTVRWCEQDGELREDYFRDLESAERAAKERAEKYDGVLLLPGTDGDPVKT